MSASSNDIPLKTQSLVRLSFFFKSENYYGEDVLGFALSPQFEKFSRSTAVPSS
jgi:hypothetical protein